jgi:hypothetical protein
MSSGLHSREGMLQFSKSSAAPSSTASPAAVDNAGSSSQSSPTEIALMSSNASHSLSAADPASAEVAASWTSRPEFRTLASLRAPGRQKYSTICGAALKFLLSLRPARVNRSAGSHIVFHFAKTGPVTLVKQHGRDDKARAGYATRLYETLSEAALRQFGTKQQLRDGGCTVSATAPENRAITANSA